MGDNIEIPEQYQWWKGRETPEEEAPSVAPTPTRTFSPSQVLFAPPGSTPEGFPNTWEEQKKHLIPYGYPGGARQLSSGAIQTHIKQGMAWPKWASDIERFGTGIEDWESGYTPGYMSPGWRPDYLPSFWEDPRRVARYYHWIQTQPEDAPIPPWLDKDQLKTAYDYFKHRNNGSTWTEWKYLHPDDPGRQFLQGLSSPPQELYFPREAAQEWMSEAAMLNDPMYQENIRQGGGELVKWEDLPAWQKIVGPILSSPAASGAATMVPWAIAATLAGGPIAGLTTLGAGAVLGAASGSVPMIADFMMVLNLPAEWLEAGVGGVAQLAGSALDPDAYGSVEEVAKNMSEAISASRTTTYAAASTETGGRWANIFQMMENTAANALPPSILDYLDRNGWGLVDQPGAKGNQVWHIGLPNPVDVKDAVGLSALVDARRAIMGGAAPEDVRLELMMRFGFSGQFNQLTGNILADPLNVMEAWGTGNRYFYAPMLEMLTENKTLVQSFENTRGVAEGVHMYRLMLRKGLHAPVPELAKMGAVTRWLAGVNADGTLRDSKISLPTPVGWVAGKIPFVGQWLGPLFNMTPEARTRELIGRTNDNLGLIASTMADASHTVFHERVRQWAQTPVEAAAEQSIKVLGGPEGYISGLALRDFVTQVGDEMVVLYDMTAPQRRTLENLAEMLGVNKEEVLQRIGEAGDADLLYQQLIERAQELTRTVEPELPEGERLPETPVEEVDPGMVQAAADILRGVERGEISSQGLRDMFKVYGEDGVAYTLAEWKAQYVSAAIEHSAQWGIGKYNVKDEHTINRFANAIKGAQSLVLLGANPVYFFNNLWNGEVTMAATGVWGMFAPERIAKLWDRIGFEPYRLEVGVGAADIGEGKVGKSDAAEMAVRRATQQDAGAIGKVNDAIRATRDKTGVFTKAAQIVERWQSRRSFTAGFLQMWKRLWRKGVGYDPMPPSLEGALRDIDPNLPGAIYGIIDGGLNQAEVEGALFGGIARNVDSFIPDVALEMGIPAEELGEVLAQTGALNYLADRLRPGMNESEVHEVFDALDNEVQTHLDDLAAQEIVNRANEAAVRIVQAKDAEGNVDVGLAYEEIAGLFDEVYLRDLVWWNDHFLRWSQTMDIVEGKSRNLKNMIVGARMATANREANRNKAYMESTLQGVIRGMDEVGIDKPKGLVANIKKMNEGWSDFFTKRDSNLREHFARDFDTGTEATDAWKSVEAENSRLYVEYGKDALQHQGAVDAALVKWVEKNVGKNAAEAIAGRREKLLDHQRDMMNVMYEYRQSLVDMTKKQRNAAWRKFLNETYMPMIAEFETLRMQEYRDIPGAPDIRPVPEGEPEGPGGPTVPETPIREVPPPKDLVQSRDRVLNRYDIEGFTEYAAALPEINKHLPEGVERFTISDYHQPENVERIADLRKTLEVRKKANVATEKVRTEAKAAGDEIASRRAPDPEYDHPEQPPSAEEEAPPTEYAATVHVDAPIPDIPIISELAAAGPDAGIVAHEHMLNFLRKHVDAEISSLQTMTPEQIARGIEALNLRGQELAAQAEAEGVPVVEVTEAIAAEPVIETETFVPEPPKDYKPLNEVPKEGEVEQQLLDIAQTFVNRTEGMPELHRENELLKLRETVDRALETYPGDKGLLEINMWYRGLRDLVVSVEKQWKYEHRGTKDVRPLMPFIPRFSDTARPSFKETLNFNKIGAEGLRIITHDGEWNTGLKGWGQRAMWVSGDPADLPFGKFGSRPDFIEKTLTAQEAKDSNLSSAVDGVMAAFDDASTLVPVDKIEYAAQLDVAVMGGLEGQYPTDIRLVGKDGTRVKIDPALYELMRFAQPDAVPYLVAGDVNRIGFMKDGKIVGQVMGMHDAADAPHYIDSGYEFAGDVFRKDGFVQMRTSAGPHGLKRGVITEIIDIDGVNHYKVRFEDGMGTYQAGDMDRLRVENIRGEEPTPAQQPAWREWVDTLHMNDQVNVAIDGELQPGMFLRDGSTYPHGFRTAHVLLHNGEKVEVRFGALRPFDGGPKDTSKPVAEAIERVRDLAEVEAEFTTGTTADEGIVEVNDAHDIADRVSDPNEVLATPEDLFNDIHDQTMAEWRDKLIGLDDAELDVALDVAQRKSLTHKSRWALREKMEREYRKIMSDPAVQKSATDTPIGEAIKNWAGPSSLKGDKRAFIEVVTDPANAQERADFQASATEAIRRMNPGKDKVILYRSKSDMNLRAWDSLSYLERAAKYFAGDTYEVAVPIENIFVDWLTHPILYRLQNEKEVILNDRGYQGAELLTVNGAEPTHDQITQFLKGTALEGEGQVQAPDFSITFDKWQARYPEKEGHLYRTMLVDAIDDGKPVPMDLLREHKLLGIKMRRDVPEVKDRALERDVRSTLYKYLMREPDASWGDMTRHLGVSDIGDRGKMAVAKLTERLGGTEVLKYIVNDVERIWNVEGLGDKVREEGAALQPWEHNFLRSFGGLPEQKGRSMTRDGGTALSELVENGATDEMIQAFISAHYGIAGGGSGVAGTMNDWKGGKNPRFWHWEGTEPIDINSVTQKPFLKGKAMINEFRRLTGVGELRAADGGLTQTEKVFAFNAWVLHELRSKIGLEPLKRADLETYAKDVGLDINDDVDASLIYDTMEGAFNEYFMERMEKKGEAEVTFVGMMELARYLEDQLVTARRTLQKSTLQQFSTPFPVAIAAAWAADIRPGDVVLEPQAGTGNLVLGVKAMGKENVEIRVNEIDPGRVEVLKLQGYDPTAVDGLSKEWLFDADGNALPRDVTVVIQNPPWGSYRTGKYGKAVKIRQFNANDWSQRFYFLTDQKVAEGGRTVSVFPTNLVYTKSRTTGEIRKAGASFRKWLDETHYVRAIIESPSGAYDTRGTKVDSILLVVDNVPKPEFPHDPIEAWGESAPRTWEMYERMVKQVFETSTHNRPREGVENAHRHLAEIARSERLATKPVRPTVGEPEVTEVGQLHEERVGGEPLPARAEGPPAPVPEPTGFGRDTRPPAVEDGGSDLLHTEVVADRVGGEYIEPPPAVDLVSDVGSRSLAERLRPGLKLEREAVEASDNFTHSTYRARDRVAPHPRPVVEAKAIAGIDPPKIDYQVHPTVQSARERGIVSDDQHIVAEYAGAAMDAGRSIVVADGTGTGKGREIAYIAWDQLESGKADRILFTTKSEANVRDMIEELKAVAEGRWSDDGLQQIPGKDFPYPMVVIHGLKLGEIPRHDKAIYLATYHDMKKYNAELMGLGLDGWLADEAHVAKNVYGRAGGFGSGGGSKVGKVWEALHKNIIANDGRISYFTATPAEDVNDLSYLFGLRYWSDAKGFENWQKIISGSISQDDAGRIEQVNKVSSYRQDIVDKLIGDSTLGEDVRVRIWGEWTTENVIPLEGTDLGVLKGKGRRWYVTQLTRTNEGVIEGAHKINRDPLSYEGEAIAVAKWLSDKVESGVLTLDETRSPRTDMEQYIKNEWHKVGLSEAVADGAIPEGAIESATKTGVKQMTGIALSPAVTEQVMRELKARGLYLSRELWRGGTEYEIVKAEGATTFFNERYGDIVALYNRVQDAYGRYAKMAGDPRAMFGVRGMLQNDLRQRLGAARMLDAIGRAEQAIAEGRRVVLSVEYISEIDPEVGNLAAAVDSIHTREVLVDDDGNVLVDEQGNLKVGAEIPEAMMEKMELMEIAREVAPAVDSPIKMVLDVFGRDRVALITGEPKGMDIKKINIDTEISKWMAGQADVAILSPRGDTGISLHDKYGHPDTGEPWPIEFIMVDYDWKGTTVLQRQGRVDRADQKSSPLYTLLELDMPLDKKFIGTIASRMQDIGATSRGGSAAATSSEMASFDIMTGFHLDAFRQAWRTFPSELKAAFPKWRNSQGMIADELPAKVNSMKKVLMELQFVHPELMTDAFDRFILKVDELQGNESYMNRQAEISARNRGTVTRTSEFNRPDGLPLRLDEVQDVDGKRFGVLSGVFMDKMQDIRRLLTTSRSRYDVESLAGISWVSFLDEKTGEVISGAKVPPSKVEGMAKHFGVEISAGITNDTALSAVHSGDKVDIMGTTEKPWTLRMRKDGLIAIDGAKMSDKERLLKYGAKYNVKGFWNIPADRVPDLLVDHPVIQKAIDDAGMGTSYDLGSHWTKGMETQHQEFLTTMADGTRIVPIKPFGHGGRTVSAAVYLDRMLVAYVPAGESLGGRFDTARGPARILGIDPDTGKNWVVQHGESELREIPIIKGDDGTNAGVPFPRAEDMAPMRMNSEVEDEGWRQWVLPALTVLRDKMTQPEARMPEFRLADMQPDVRNQMYDYMGKVKGQMADTKMAALKWGENRRDAALLNYSRRYGFDNVLGAVYPYQFWYTRSMVQWMLRALDRPSWFANYARLRNMQRNSLKVPGFPRRLQDKAFIPMPFLPEWAGGGMWVDPFRQFFVFEQFTRPWEQAYQDKNMQKRRAESILREWVDSGDYSAQDVQQAVTQQSGPVWDKAFAQARLEVQTESANPYDFMNLIMSPSLPISIGLNVLRGTPEKIGHLPPTRAIQAVTSLAGSALTGEPQPGVNIEAGLRRAVGLNEADEWGQWKIDRQLAAMSAEGVAPVQDVERAMIEQSGQVYDLARGRAGMETGLGFAGSIAGSPGSLYTKGEQELRGMQPQLNAAYEWASKTGDRSRITEFYDEHPEYEVRNLEFKEPAERLKSHLVGILWDNYMALGSGDKKAVREQLGPIFQQAFLDKETRSYEALDNQTLSMWARLIGGIEVPSTPETEQAPDEITQMLTPAMATGGVEYAPEGIREPLNRYGEERNRLHPDWYMLVKAYGEIPKSESSKRRQFREQFPMLDSFWDWENDFLLKHPEIIPYVKPEGWTPRSGTTRDMLTSEEMAEFDAGLVSALVRHFYAGEQLGAGALRSLEMQWENLGRPDGSMDSWLNGVVHNTFNPR